MTIVSERQQAALDAASRGEILSARKTITSQPWSANTLTVLYRSGRLARTWNDARQSFDYFDPTIYEVAR
jgi:hypothetical protein